MANRFWNFVTTFTAGTLARAEDVNTNYSGIEAGLDANAAELDQTIQVTNSPGTTFISDNAAARANKVLAFDAAGNVVASTSIGLWRGDHAAAAGTAYNVRDLVRDATGALGLNNLYICNTEHTSTGNLLADTANWDLVINVVDVETAKTAAETAQTGAETAETNAGTQASAAAASATLASQWAALVTGIVGGTDYSAKAWAVGGTGVTDTATRGAAKEWASNAHGDLVDTVEYSAKHYSVEAAASAASVLGKQTMWVPAQAMTPTVSNGCEYPIIVETTAGRPDIIVMDFDAVADEFAQFQVAFPKQWNEGTVTAQFFWTSNSANTGAVIWSIEGVAVSDGGTIDVAYGAQQTVVDAGVGLVERVQVSPETSAMTIAGTPAEGDVCYFRVGRDADNASDTFTADARLIGIKLHFTNDTGNDA